MKDITIKENNTEIELKRGRPEEYTEELANRICEKITQGMSLKSTVEQDEDLPSLQTIYSWLSKHNNFLDNYTQATQNRTEAQLEELNRLGDIAIQEASNTGDKRANAVVQAYKLKADNMKWVMSKMKPKKYGDKLELAGDQDNPITVNLISYAKPKIYDNIIDVESKPID